MAPLISFTLILIVTNPADGRDVAITTSPFANKLLCEAAGEAVVRRLPDYKPQYLCVQKDYSHG